MQVGRDDKWPGENPFGDRADFRLNLQKYFLKNAALYILFCDLLGQRLHFLIENFGQES